MKRLFFLPVLTLALLAGNGVSRGQALNPVAQQVPFFAAALSEFISDTRAFTAKAELHLPAAPEEKPLVLPFTVAMLDGKMRWDLNVNQLKQSALPEEASAILQQLSLDRLVIIKKPEQKTVLLFPSTRAYTELTMERNAEIENQAELKMGRMERKLVGKETVDGHPCNVYHLVLPEDKAKEEEAAVWQATDLKDLPIRIRVKVKADVYMLQFRNVVYRAPEAKVFEIPAGFTRYDNADAMVQAAVLKSFNLNALQSK